MRIFFLIFGALTATLALAYGNAIHMDFIGDDWGRIAHNDILNGGFSEVIHRLMPDRPVLTASLWINQHLLGPSVEAYKWVNLILQGLVAGMLMIFMRDLAPSLKAKPWIPLLLALIFCAHPLNNQAVNSIIQRGVLFSTFFLLLALHLYIGGRTKPLIVFLCGLLAVLSKTNALILPLLLLAYERLCLQTPWKMAFKKVSLFFLIWLAPLIYYYGMGVNEQHYLLPMKDYFMLQWKVIFIYLRLMLWPQNLHFSYTFNTENLAADPWVWMALLGHLSLFAGLIFLWRKGEKALVFCGAAMYLAFLPESSVFPIRHLAFEHRAYLPLAFVLCGVAVALSKLSSPPRWLAPLLGIFALGFSFANANYNSKIKTHEQWIWYNISQNNADVDFNVYNLTYILDHNRPECEKLTQELLRLYPDNVIYQKYLQMARYPQMDAKEKENVLREMYKFLIYSKVRVYGYARLAMIQFYGQGVHEFLTGRPYYEHMDDFLYYQVSDLRHSGMQAVDLFVVYRDNLMTLAPLYAAQPPADSWRAVRVLLALKANFGIGGPEVEQKVMDWLKTCSPQQKAQWDEFMKTENQPLPVAQDKVL